MSACQISGIITDVSTLAAIDNAKISLLNPVTGDVLYTDIYTDGSGSYDATVNLNFTSVRTRPSAAPSSYLMSEFHPNPVTPENNETLTIQYQVPDNELETPILEMYNILGRKVNHHGFLTSGIYICRLRFNNGYVSESRKLMLTSGSFLKLSLNQIFGNPGQTFKSSEPDVRLIKEAGDTLEVLFKIEKTGYACMERSRKLIQGINNETNFSLVQIGNQSIVTLDTTGGIITVANSRNDSITLTIPRYALWEPTTITLSTFDTQPNNPIHNNIFPGVNISPGGFRPHRPASLKVTFAATDVDTNLSTLFYIKQSDFVLPLGKIAVTDSSIEGDIYHFSDYSAGDPSGNEAIDQAGKAAEGGALNPFDWQGTYDVVEAMIRWADMLQGLGRDAEAQAILDKVREIIERDASNFINQPVPENPCGWYKNALTKFSELVFSFLVYGDLVSQYSARVGEIFNRCGIQGDIVCQHDIVHEAPPYYYDRWIVNGIIPFIGTEEFGHLTGHGVSDVTVTGQAGGASIIGFGTNTITLSGELTNDYQGDFWLDIEWIEECWTTSSWTFYPPDPDDPPFTISQPIHTDVIPLNFPALNGAVIHRFNAYTWILNLYNLFPEVEE
ncbi:hypothetical protein HQ585_08055 [candidate division KSB1 bacterium]|nr:hypothetical protein [candidate division KSB1 bacterium]